MAELFTISDCSGGMKDMQTALQYMPVSLMNYTLLVGCVDVFQTVPADFHDVLTQYTQDGYRVIALACRDLGAMSNVDALKISREDAEVSGFVYSNYCIHVYLAPVNVGRISFTYSLSTFIHKVLGVHQRHSYQLATQVYSIADKFTFAGINGDGKPN